MARYEDNDDDFETIVGTDGRPVRILRDGRRHRVPLTMRDSATPPDRPLTTDEMTERMVRHRRHALVTDGSGNPWGMSRPGFRFPVDPSVRAHHRRVLQDAYEEYERDLREAYKTPNNNSEVTCQPADELDRDQLDGMSLAELQQHRQRVTDAAYKQYEADLSSAWKTR